ncbi:MAG: hypothetical protein WC992_01540 [Acholeplasmataceae bacterium]|jgi:hypothetical protein|nr:hypothetical protein [Acholeplasmataceae bacterium]
MKSLINRIGQFFYRYKKLVKMIDSKAQVKNVVKSVFGALGISFIILLLPALVIINMFIIAKLTLFLAILLVLLVVAWPFLYYAFYYILLKNYHEPIRDMNTRIPLLVEATIISLVLLTIGIIVLSIIF